jgi:hypothetical protein
MIRRRTTEAPCTTALVVEVAAVTCDLSLVGTAAAVYGGYVGCEASAGEAALAAHG